MNEVHGDTPLEFVKSAVDSVFSTVDFSCDCDVCLNKIKDDVLNIITIGFAENGWG
jgi:hypothetical protein